jgi:hypothetical protein
MFAWSQTVSRQPLERRFAMQALFRSADRTSNAEEVELESAVSIVGWTVNP